MPPYTSQADKELVAEHLVGWAREHHTLTVKRYFRLGKWLNGDTFEVIAREEGVTKQAVGQTVRRDFKEILAFAKSKT